ncbi:MAG: precorrin-6y C5,15-methyltransferase (decarboxylating) subunit CbiE [Gemmataceae bacterium]|nr:precorrin-6y C5,15-methyltransferase (decarboxylating) subunit CbiE [Gemmataceae bacterium]MDW8266416.1 precorrin-6y C5,15-methyltransferase (decarboxylating) subunit CbiE [Gemmataceae bacterium]
MVHPAIHIIGIGADGPAGLRREQIEHIAAADFLAGGERHLRYFPAARGERFVIKDNLPELLDQLWKRFLTQRCVVLASGDPLFYGIGTSLVSMLGPSKVRIEPALSAMQLAFARAGVTWQDAALSSIHGRDLRATLLPLLGRRRIGLFTLDGESPAAVARFFLRYGLNDYEATVGENLGSPEERVTHWPNLSELASQRFAALNYLVLQRTRSPLPVAELEHYRSLVPGIPDTAFARPEEAPEMLTRQEVRAVLLAKLASPAKPGDVFWDIGAGLGSVSIEVAVLRPQLEVVAVEADPKRVAFIQQNRERFDAYNVRVVEGTAPAALAEEKHLPRYIFIGGSGDHLSGILDLAQKKLLAQGQLLATFVTLEHLTEAVQRLRGWHWPFSVTELHVARSDALGRCTGLKPQRGVFIVDAEKPESVVA